MDRKWWKESIVYQIYPSSFQDSDGDGIGDLNGIRSRLDYLKDLGVNVLWLCPIMDSPMDDNGYDISNYQAINPRFGTMEDFDALLAEAHQRGIRIVMDLVVNHSSDEHPWFIESRKSVDNPYRDYYIWKPGKDGHEPNNWGASFGGSAWKYDPQTDMYYLHLFSPKQPDLNWENPKVRDEVFNMMTWWFDKGIDGFRMDVISMISKDQRFPDGEKHGLYGNGGPYYVNGPRIHEFLQEMNRRVLSKYDIMTVGETPGATVENAPQYAGLDGKELNMVFQFEHVGIGDGPLGKWTTQRYDFMQLKKILSHWQTGLDGKAWNSLFWGNHDQPRAASRWGDDSPLSAKMLAFNGWALIYFDGISAIYLPRTPANQSLIENKELKKQGLSILSDRITAYRHQLGGIAAQPPPADLIGAGSLLLANGNFKQASGIFALLTRGSPKMAGAWLNLGRCQLELGETE